MQDKLFILPSRESVEPGQAFKDNLPVQLTPLIGREQDVAAASALLRHPEVRLLTFTGTGGVGKTRLGLQVATELLSHFADGVYFVPLAPIRDAELVVSTIAQMFGLRETGGQPLLAQLKAYLREKHLLLLLDNFEQVLVAAPLLTELLQECCDLKMIVTSRAVLSVSGEHEFPVPPLAFPDLNRLLERETLTQYAAVVLFLQRAKAIKSDFQLTDTNARTIAEMCVRLEGLPLAIELAAARMKLLPPQALLTRLDKRLQVLTSGARDMPARQQTLRNTLAWSYDLLTVEEQHLFRRLAVFVGGCTLEAAEAVCNASNELAIDVLDGVTSLLNKSLLQQTAQEGEEARLVMLETIREYGLECLAASGELKATRQGYAAYYLKLAEETEPKLKGVQQVLWMERLEQEHDNLRAALRWLVEQEEIEMALRLCGALYQFWTTHGHWSEGRQWLESILSGSSGETVSLVVRAKALTGAGMIACMQGNYSRANLLCQESLELFRKLDNQPGIAAAIKGLAFVALARGQYEAASALLKEGMVPLRALGDKWNLAEVLFFAAVAATYRIDQIDLATARSMLEESLVLSRELGDQRIQAYSLNHLGFLALLQGEGAAACHFIEESLVIHEALGNREGIAYASLTYGWFFLSQGDYVTARTHYEKGLAIMIDLGNKWFTAASLEGIAMAVVPSAAEGSTGSALWAARLWGTANALRESIGAPLRSFERGINEWGVATIRAQLGEEAFAAAWAEGRTMTPQQSFMAREPVTLHEQVPVSRPTNPSKAASASPADLTAREVEVLRLVSQGLTDAQVAKQLVISRRTVNWYLTTIYSKIGVSSRSAATRYAIEHKLV